MSRSKLNPKIMNLMKEKIRGKITEQAIRNALSRIRAKYPGITMNAAAFIFANERGFKVMKHLTEDDRKSLANSAYSAQYTTRETKLQKYKTKKPSISFGQKFLTEAYHNAEIYPYIYILENTLRKLIIETFSDEPDWWEKRVKGDVQEYAKTVQKAEAKHDWLPRRGNHPIYYIGLYELYRIISRNYLRYFKTVFKDEGNLRTWINECVPIRNLLAHNVKIQASERQNAKIRVKYICTLVEKYSRISGVSPLRYTPFDKLRTGRTGSKLETN